MDLAKRVVALEIGEPISSAQVAAGGVRICEKLSLNLANIVGQVGIRTLLDRSLTLTRAAFPWIANVGMGSEGSRWAALEVCLVKQDVVTALEGFTSFLASFIALFGRLIGDAMVARLLHDIWPDVLGLKERT
jgi:hypothetical protein